jgi:hypothetical protein
MEKKQKLKKLLDIMGFSLSFIISLLLFSGCFSYNPDFENKVVINNNTKDTLLFQVTKKYISDIPGDEIDLLPGSNTLGLHHTLSSFEIIQDNWKYRGDTVEIHRKGYLPIKWAAPLREMPDSVHHFFNKNSWEIKMGGHKDEWEIATFTITEEDFKK